MLSSANAQAGRLRWAIQWRASAAPACAQHGQTRVPNRPGPQLGARAATRRSRDLPACPAPPAGPERSARMSPAGYPPGSRAEPSPSHLRLQPLVPPVAGARARLRGRARYGHRRGAARHHPLRAEGRQAAGRAAGAHAAPGVDVAARRGAGDGGRAGVGQAAREPHDAAKAGTLNTHPRGTSSGVDFSES